MKVATSYCYFQNLFFNFPWQTPARMAHLFAPICYRSSYVFTDAAVVSHLYYSSVKDDAVMKTSKLCLLPTH